MAATFSDDFEAFSNGTLYDFMFGHEDAAADLTWFIDSLTGDSLTGAQLKRRTDSLALGLQAHLSLGTADLPSASMRGDVREVVSLITPNDLDFGPCAWGLHRLGCTVAPSNSGCTAQELTHQLKLTSARAVIVHPLAVANGLEAAQACGIPREKVVLLSRDEDGNGLTTTETLIRLGEKLAREGQKVVLPASRAATPAKPRVAFLCFSSGTTGLPKAVMIPHRSMMSTVLQLRNTAIPGTNAIAGRDRALGLVPFTHMYGLLVLHLCPLLGVATVSYPSLPHPFTTFLDSMEEYRVNHLFLVPPLLNAFVKHPACATRDFSRYWKTGMVAAAPLDSSTEDSFTRMCRPEFIFSQTFGMTETTGLVTCLPAGVSPLSGSVSRLLAKVEGKITAEDGSVVYIPPGKGPGRTLYGELSLRTPQLSLGYLNNEEANAATFDEEGYLLTGDIVEVTPDGEITIVDRLKHIMKCKGYQVSPAEIEGTLRQHEYVQDVGVVGRPDERAGEVPVAFVVLTAAGKEAVLADRTGVETTLKDYVKGVKSDYKWLAAVYFADVIPRLPSGKILARELKRMLPPPAAAQSEKKPNVDRSAHPREKSAVVAPKAWERAKIQAAMQEA